MVEAIASPSIDCRELAKLFKKVIFSRFELLRVFISDNGIHFIENKLGAPLKKYGGHHKYSLG